MSVETSLATASELQEIERANASGKQPVVFVHGLWLLDSSWDRWAAFFEDAGYVAVTPGGPTTRRRRGRPRRPGRCSPATASATSPPISR